MREPVYKSPRVAFRETQEGGVLLHLDSGSYHGINGIGVLVWSMLDGRTVEEIADAIRSEVEAPPPDVDSDIREFVHDLIERGLATSDPD